jgi:hypothetical protein
MKGRALVNDHSPYELPKKRAGVEAESTAINI